MRNISFAAIIRTALTEPEQLRDSLKALTFQLEPCRAVVVVHASADAFRNAESLCASIEGLDFKVLHANDLKRKPGYAINIGLEYCYSAVSNIEYLSFLDDTGMLYPFFTRVMSNAFLTTEADVICQPWNRRYAVRLNTLRVRKVWMDESLDADAVWQFLVTLLKSGFGVETHFSALSGDFVRDEPVPDPSAQLTSLQSRIFELEHSWSWRLSLPLRIVGSIFADRKP
jgi:hypothetical protein